LERVCDGFETKVFAFSGENMKIALLTPTFSKFSGIDRVLELDVEEYSKKGDDVTIFALKSTMKSKYAKIIELGMPKSSFFERLYRLFFHYDFGKVDKYVEMLKDYDLVVSYFYPMSWLAYKAKKRYGVKYVYYDFGVAFPELFGFFERIYMRLFIMFNNLTVKNCDKAISISKFLQGELKKQTGIKSKVEYCKIDKRRFHKGVGSKKIRDKYKLKNAPVLLYVGRISPHKGIHLLIKSFNLVLKKIPDAKLLIVGKPTFDSYSKKLKRLAKGNVIFTGFVPDEELPYYYAACDLYVTATLWEGFDLPVVEAQTMGKKVVAFDLCSHPEVVKKGILVKSGDVNGFADGVVRLLRKNA